MVLRVFEIVERIIEPGIPGGAHDVKVMVHALFQKLLPLQSLHMQLNAEHFLPTFCNSMSKKFILFLLVAGNSQSLERLWANI